MASKEKKKTKKQEAKNRTNSWPDLPQQLISLIERESTQMKNVFSKGVTKSWRLESKKCNRKSTLPWLQVSDEHYQGKPDNQTDTYGITIKPGCRQWRPRWGYYLVPRLQYLGCSQGLIVAKAVAGSVYSLRHPGNCSWWVIPEWDSRVPFLCAVLSSSPDNEPYKFRLMVLTGVSSPAFVFFSARQCGWIKQDCTIADPHCTNPSERHHFMKFTNAIGYKGKFYALSLQGTLAVIEEDDNSEFRIIGLGKYRAVPSVTSLHFRECLVASDGELLLVFLICKKSVNIVDDVEVYQLNFADLTWIRKRCLGERSLFLGTDCCISVIASKVGCCKNCLYFKQGSDGDWWLFDMEKAMISPASKRVDESIQEENEIH